MGKRVTKQEGQSQAKKRRRKWKTQNIQGEQTALCTVSPVTYTGRANDILYVSTAVTYNTLQVWSGVFQGFTDVRFQKTSNKQHAKKNQDQREHTSNSKVPYKPSDISVTPITLYTAWHSKNNAVFRKPYLFQCCASRNIKQRDGWSSAVNWTIP